MRYAIALFALAAFAQDNTKGPIVSLNPAGPPQGVTALNFYDGSSNLIYRCQAVSIQPQYRWTVAASTLTNVVVLTNVGTITTATAHGLSVGNSITLSGHATTALNATYVIATVPSTTTFTIATSGVANATYTTGLVMTTTAPRSSAAIWSIRRYQYSGTNLTNEQWIAGSTAMQYVCDDRATLAAQ